MHEKRGAHFRRELLDGRLQPLDALCSVRGENGIYVGRSWLNVEYLGKLNRLRCFGLTQCVLLDHVPCDEERPDAP